MKRLNLMFLIIGVAIIFSACSKDDSLAPLSQNDQETNLKKAKVEATFTGVCTLIHFVPENTWFDATDDWRTTGTTIWVQPDPGKFEGTSTLFVDVNNPHDKYPHDKSPHYNNRGIWNVTWSGTITPNAEGMVIVATAEGIGVKGQVKGMIGHWTYTMDYVGGFDIDGNPDPTHPSFIYAIEGNIKP